MATKIVEKDLYATLEIVKDASETDIKKAYKKMALKWHPDKNPENTAAAEEMFKEIAEAYAILNNPEKRKLYDKYGYAGVNPSSPAGPANFTRGGGASAGFGFQDFTFDSAERIFEEFFSKNPFEGFGSEFPSFFGRRKRGAGATEAQTDSDKSPFSGGSPFGASPFGASPFSGGSPFGDSSPMFGGHQFFKNAFAAHQGMMKDFGNFGGGFGDFFGAGGMGGGFEGFGASTGSTGGVGKSVSTTTKMENGRKVTVTKTTTRGADGVTKTEVTETVDDGKGNRHEKRYLADGTNQQKPAQHKIADAHKPHQAHGHSHGHGQNQNHGHSHGHTQNQSHSHTQAHAHGHGHSHGHHGQARPQVYAQAPSHQTHGHAHGHHRGPMNHHN